MGTTKIVLTKKVLTRKVLTKKVLTRKILLKKFLNLEIGLIIVLAARCRRRALRT